MYHSINPNYTPDYFNPGDEVIYVPSHSIEAYALWVMDGHPDYKFTYSNYQKGIVKSKNDTFVFVNYYDKKLQELSETAQATSPKDLVLWKKNDIKQTK